MKDRTNVWATILLTVGLLQMCGDLLDLPILKGIGAATAASPASKVFTTLRGYEAFSTRFSLEWTDHNGQQHSVQLTPDNYTKLRGPYNRRNVFGAVLAGGPILASDPKLRPMFDEVSAYALGHTAVALRELGIDPATICGHLRIRYETTLTAQNLPTELEIVCR